MLKIRKIKILSLICILFLFFYLFFIFIKKNFNFYCNKNACTCSSLISINTNNNKIKVLLDIMDIYRLDISCDYVKTALGQEINNQYSNNKKCSYSTINSDINNRVLSSIIKNNINKTDYKLYLNNKNEFEPFSSNNSFIIQPFIELKPGGLWIPTLKNKKSIACRLNDLDNIVFIGLCIINKFYYDKCIIRQNY
jgi:hypothetical protein